MYDDRTRRGRRRGLNVLHVRYRPRRRHGVTLTTSRINVTPRYAVVSTADVDLASIKKRFRLLAIPILGREPCSSWKIRFDDLRPDFSVFADGL